jgi:hypothetical protein
MPQTPGIARPTDRTADDPEVALLAPRTHHSPPAPTRQSSQGVPTGPVPEADPLTRAERGLLPHDGPANPATLRRHMDACVALAVGAGLCRGRALAAHASVLEACGEDLHRADEQLVASLRGLLGLEATSRQEH